MAFSPGAITPIQAQASGIEILVGGTDEEAWIYREMYRLLEPPDGKRGIAFMTLNRLIPCGEQ